MLLLELLLSRLQNSNTSLFFWHLFTGLKFLNGLNIKSFLSQNSQYHSATISLWRCIYTAASSGSQHTLFTLCHSDQTTIIVQSHSPRSFRHASTHLWNQLFLHNLGFLIQILLFIPLSATIIWTCRFNLLNTAITFHHFFSLWAQNLKITSSENLILHLIVCFCLSDWSHGSRPFNGLTCSSVFMF